MLPLITTPLEPVGCVTCARFQMETRSILYGYEVCYVRGDKILQGKILIENEKNQCLA